MESWDEYDEVATFKEVVADAKVSFEAEIKDAFPNLIPVSANHPSPEPIFGAIRLVCACAERN